VRQILKSSNNTMILGNNRGNKCIIAFLVKTCEDICQKLFFTERLSKQRHLIGMGLHLGEVFRHCHRALLGGGQRNANVEGAGKSG
jgi:hypothetical protein